KLMLRGNERRSGKTHGGLKTEGSLSRRRKARSTFGGESKAAANSRHFSGPRTKRVRSARAASAAACEDLTINSVSLTCWSLAARTSTALTCGLMRRLTRLEATRRCLGGRLE